MTGIQYKLDLSGVFEDTSPPEVPTDVFKPYTITVEITSPRVSNVWSQLEQEAASSYRTLANQVAWLLRPKQAYRKDAPDE